VTARGATASQIRTSTAGSRFGACQADNLTDRRNLAMFLTIGTHQTAETALDGRGVARGVAASSRAVLLGEVDLVARHGVVDWQIQ
jgi:hypothetical protein